MEAIAIPMVPPDPGWAAAFDTEAAWLRMAFSSQPGHFALHHIGSTAIAGIWAKPVIDMLAVAPNLVTLDAAAPQLVKLGYEALGEFGIAGRRYFRKTTAAGVRTHQLHAFAAGSEQIARHLAFKDYMNAHPEAAQAYSDLKRQLASSCSDMGAYMDGKDAFVKQHEQLALAWASNQAAHQN